MQTDPYYLDKGNIFVHGIFVALMINPTLVTNTKLLEIKGGATYSLVLSPTVH